MFAHPRCHSLPVTWSPFTPPLPPYLKCQNFKRIKLSGSNSWLKSLKFSNLTIRLCCHSAVISKESLVLINKSSECSHAQIESWIEIVTFLVISLKRHNSETNRRIGLIFCTVTSHDLFYYCIKFQEFLRSKPTPTSLPAWKFQANTA